MIEIGRLVNSKKLDHAGPKPRGRIEYRCSSLRELSPPSVPSCLVHLPAMRSANNTRQTSCKRRRLVTSEAVDFDLEILGHQLAQDDWSFQKARSNHSVTQVG